jgi:predicted SnoaL-like aldol condensation-catalyzing enzyme
MKIKDLILILKKKPQNQNVEFIVVTDEGQLVAMELERTAKDMSAVIKLMTVGRG